MQTAYKLEILSIKITFQKNPFKRIRQKDLHFVTGCDIILKLFLGVAQMVARYLGVVEAVGSNPATQTMRSIIKGSEKVC